jgi:hypothetical protein
MVTVNLIDRPFTIRKLLENHIRRGCGGLG